MLGFGIRESTTTTGTGNLTVASETGYPTFNAVFPSTVGRRFFYSITDADGKPIEHGIGYLSAATTLVRETILATFISGTYNDITPSAVNLAAGTKYVICSVPTSTQSLPPTPFINSSIVKAVNGPYYNSYNNGGSPAPGAWIFEQVHVPFDCLCTGMSANLSIAAVAGKVFHMGLYDMNASGQPRKLLFDSGNIAADSTGFKTYTLGTNIRLKAGFYWRVWDSDGGPQFTTGGHVNPAGAHGALQGGAQTYASYYYSGGYGSFTDNPPANSFVAFSQGGYFLMPIRIA